ncbi:MAG: response regulator [Candidatus Omnitrophota bacterium]
MSSIKPIVYVVDDDVSICRSLTLLLESHGFHVETFSGAIAFLAFKHPRVPSCLLLDVNLPDINGPVLQDTMSAEQLAIPIVFITGHGSIPIGIKAMKQGAVDFLPKPYTETDLLNAVDRAIARSKAQNTDAAEIVQINKRIKTLSPRELEVFHFVAKGMLNKQIAKKRGTALQTIKVHRSRVMNKLQAKTVTELIYFAQKSGIVNS